MRLRRHLDVLSKSTGTRVLIRPPIHLLTTAACDSQPTIAAAEQTFHPFPQLPPELREEIWRYCLPYQARELDVRLADNVYWNEPRPCQLQDTSLQNSHPPLLTRICRESRAVALKAGVLLTDNTQPASADWYVATTISQSW